jgi:pimeloyl-ACP methyl ester carboxylesterase
VITLHQFQKFQAVREGKPVKGERKAVVFVHGLFSSHHTFDDLVKSFAEDSQLTEWDLAVFDYDWGEPILKNAEYLRRILTAKYPESYAEVTLIGHSMGGVVSRFALIADDLPCVRRIVMLGTPNFGAMTASRISTLWQMAIAAAGEVKPVFPRKAGMRDLTRIQTLYLQIAGPEGNLPPSRAREVEYVTVPGMYYNSDRADADPGRDFSALPFTIGTLIFRVFAAWPWAELKIEAPHDGIVEEQSVSLMPSPGRVSEKTSDLETGEGFETYAHIVPLSMFDSTHMQIQSDPAVARTLKEIIRIGSIAEWRKGMSRQYRDSFASLVPSPRI